MRFMDVFAGCGGLSLGLLKAGCTGVVAIEKNPMAFETLRHNLINGVRYQFEWPDLLPVEAMSCESFLENYSDRIPEMCGEIDLMVGGPPCQGFSNAGRRDPNDPRNKMAEQYLALVSLIRPSYIVIENVTGFNSPFTKAGGVENIEGNIQPTTYADFIALRLSTIGYKVSRGKINCADFGVPQNRHRYLILASLNDEDLFEKLSLSKTDFKASKGLSSLRDTTSYDALADLEIAGGSLIKNHDSGRPGFKELEYAQPAIVSPYLRLMRDGFNGSPNSMRLPNHKPKTIDQFRKVISVSTPGKSLSKAIRDTLGMRKHAITVLNKDTPAPTITTLPDDIIHYSELRILTARENARLQSFPDWFEFTGKYTTGGQARKSDCPRYTQIGNAVPPLLSEAIGVFLQYQAVQNLRAGICEA